MIFNGARVEEAHHDAASRFTEEEADYVEKLVGNEGEDEGTTFFLLLTDVEQCYSAN